jgi:HD-GYP domain-containing protein (c-di-GMP phosphodiesterase class II)
MSLVSEAIESLALVIELDEKQKLYHAWRVATLAEAIATTVAPEERTDIFFGGLLHDIGAIGVDDRAVHAATKKEPSAEIRAHPARSARIIAAIPGLGRAAHLVADHHEHFAGEGYPRKARRDDVADGSYVLGIADQLEVALRATPPADRLTTAVTLVASGSGMLWPWRVCDAAIALLSEGSELLDDLFDPARLASRVARARSELTPVPALLEEEALTGILINFARVMDAKHHYTAGHSLRVAYLTGEIAAASQTLGVRDAVWGGLVHDIGKVGISRRLLDKEGMLCAGERLEMQKHTRDTFEIISHIARLRHLAAGAAAHHEQWNGGGYPQRLAGEEIPLLGRALAYADVYDAIRSDRSYRMEVSYEDAVEQIHAEVGRHFDPSLERAAFDVFGRCRSATDLARDLSAFVERFAPGASDVGEIVHVP